LQEESAREICERNHQEKSGGGSAQGFAREVCRKNLLEESTEGLSIRNMWEEGAGGIYRRNK